MSSSPPTFGRRAVDVSPLQLLELERTEKRAELFSEFDRVVGRISRRALRGEAVVRSKVTAGCATVIIDGLEREDRRVVDDVFALDSQQARGAWFLPEEARIKLGLINFFAYMTKEPRYATTRAFGLAPVRWTPS